GDHREDLQAQAPDLRAADLVLRTHVRRGQEDHLARRLPRHLGAAARPVLRVRRTAFVACALFLLSCALGFGGLLSHAFPGDTVTYAKYGRALVHDGRIPYRDFYDEYPPGSVPVFAAPALLWDAHYVLVFKLLMTACGVGLVVATTWALARLRLSYLRLAP